MLSDREVLEKIKQGNDYNKMYFREEIGDWLPFLEQLSEKGYVTYFTQNAQITITQSGRDYLTTITSGSISNNHIINTQVPIANQLAIKPTNNIRKNVSDFFSSNGRDIVKDIIVALSVLAISSFVVWIAMLIWDTIK